MPPSKLIEWARLFTPIVLIVIAGFAAAGNQRLGSIEEKLKTLDIRIHDHIRFHLELPLTGKRALENEIFWGNSPA